MTPLHLEILVHFHVVQQPFPRATAPACALVIREFIEQRIIEPSGLQLAPILTETMPYRLSEKGRAWLTAILSTRIPSPRTVWVDESGNQLEVERDPHDAPPQHFNSLNRLTKIQPVHFGGHDSLADMIRGHIEPWRDALKTQRIDQHDTKFIDHELRALDLIEKAVEVELGL